MGQTLIVVLMAFLFILSGTRGGANEQDAPSAPRFDYVDMVGCGDVFFHAVNGTQTEILRIEIDPTRFRSTASRQVFNLAALPAGVAVDVTLYRYPENNRPNCYDLRLTEVGAPPNPPEVWRPLSGQLEVERGSKGVRPDEPWLFSARIRLLAAQFRGPGPRDIKMPKPFVWQGLVGWMAG